MEKYTGMTLNLEKSSDGSTNKEWYLYFDAGVFTDFNKARTTDDFILRLKKYKEKEKCQKQNKTLCGYHLFYDPNYDSFTLLDDTQYSDSCLLDDLGHHIGGYVVDFTDPKNCRIIFVYPKNCDVDENDFRRDFEDEFDANYNKLSINCDTPQGILDDVCGQFLEENFSDAYDINCLVIEEENQFKKVEFDKSYEIPQD